MIKEVRNVFLAELLQRQKKNTDFAIKHGEFMITYEEWYNSSLRLSRIVDNFATKDSKNVGIFLPNSIYYAVAYFSIVFSNKIIVPIGIQSKEQELTSTLGYCEIDIIITSLQYRNYFIESLKKYNHKIVLLFVEEQTFEVIGDDKEFTKKSNAIKNIGNENDVVLMLHTSGTTSNPKRVMLTHRNLITNIESNIASLNLSCSDKTLIALPMYFGYCNTAQFLTHLYLGASMIIMDGIFLPKQFFCIVEKESITNFTGVPSMLIMLLDYRYSNRYEFGSLRYICFGGGKMPIDKLKKLIEKYSDIGFVQTYGQTECSPRVTVLQPEDSLRKLGSVGKAIPNVEVRILNKNGKEVSRKEIGEIVVRGSNVMKGYYKQPDLTQEVIRDGWVHTGDLGYLDGDYLYLTGRSKNVIISGGINIYPEEIEEILLQHGGVRDVCVIGEEHKRMGEVPIAKVVLKFDVTEVELKQYCSKKIANYKVPVRFDFVEKLPKTYNGKNKRI